MQRFLDKSAYEIAEMAGVEVPAEYKDPDR